MTIQFNTLETSMLFEAVCKAHKVLDVLVKGIADPYIEVMHYVHSAWNDVNQDSTFDHTAIWNDIRATLSQFLLNPPPFHRDNLVECIQSLEVIAPMRQSMLAVRGELCKLTRHIFFDEHMHLSLHRPDDCRKFVSDFLPKVVNLHRSVSEQCKKGSYDDDAFCSLENALSIVMEHLPKDAP